MITALLRTAAHEYDEALTEAEEGFRLAHEYQAALGVVLVAGDLLEAMGPALRAQDARVYAALEKDFKAIRSAWPTPDAAA